MNSSISTVRINDIETNVSEMLSANIVKNIRENRTEVRFVYPNYAQNISINSNQINAIFSMIVLCFPICVTAGQCVLNTDHVLNACWLDKQVIVLHDTGEEIQYSFDDTNIAYSLVQKMTNLLHFVTNKTSVFNCKFITYVTHIPSEVHIKYKVKVRTSDQAKAFNQIREIDVDYSTKEHETLATSLIKETNDLSLKANKETLR